MLYSITFIANLVFLVAAIFAWSLHGDPQPAQPCRLVDGTDSLVDSGTISKFTAGADSPNNNRVPSHALKRYLAGLPFFQILR